MGLSVFNFHHSHLLIFRAYESDVAMLTSGSFRVPLLGPVKPAEVFQKRSCVFSILLHKTNFEERREIIVISSYPAPA